MSVVDIIARVQQLRTFSQPPAVTTSSAATTTTTSGTTAGAPGATAGGTAGTTTGASAGALTAALEFARQLDAARKSEATRQPEAAARPGKARSTDAARRTETTSSVTATGGAGSAAGGAAVVKAAREYLGVPYVWGGTNPRTGLDCSGMIQRAFKDVGIKVPRLSWDQARAGTAVSGGLKNARPGDIIGLNGNSHVGIYVGNGKMIHAPQPGENVKISKVYGTPSAIRRIVPQAVAASGPVLRPQALKPTGSADEVSGVPFANLFNAAGAKHGVSPTLLAAVAKVESNYNTRAVSPAGARGLMQFMPGTAAEMGVRPLDPKSAINGAARLLAKHIRTFDSVNLALAAYNAGPGAVRQYGGIPPYAETQAYVPKVRKAMNALQGR